MIAEKLQTQTICSIKIGQYTVRLNGSYTAVLPYGVYAIPEDEPAIEYARKVLNGTYIACENEKLGCARFLYELEAMNDPDYPYIYDFTRAERFFRFASKCANVDGEVGEKLILQDFQKYDFGNIFGWVRKDNGVRRFTEALIYESRGQGKSTIGACVSLYGLTADCWYMPYKMEERKFENEPNIVTLAVDREQCKQVRGCAMSMAKMSPEIFGQTDVGLTFIRGKKRGGTITSVSKEIGNLDGGKISIIICDEWAAHKEEQRLATLRGSFGKKKQCLLIKITTAGLDCAVKPAFNDYERCCSILRGVFTADRYFISIREMEENDKVNDWEKYEKCTPMLRSHTDYAERLFDAIKTEYQTAFEGGTETQKTEFLTKRTNRWQISSEDKFLDIDDFNHLRKCQLNKHDFEKLVVNRPCIVATDLSKNTDISAVAFIFNMGDGRIAIHTHGFMPRESLSKHIKTDKVPYREYIDKGLITLIEGTYIDTKVIEDYICDYEQRLGLNIKKICTDPAFAANFLNNMSEGRNKNHESYECVEVRQTTTVLNEPTNLFAVKMKAEELIIEESELFVLHCSNAYVQYDNGGQRKICKKNAQSPYRIDLLAATIFGLKHISELEGETLVALLQNGMFTF